MFCPKIKITAKRLIPLWLLFSLVFSSPALAFSVAVFPVEDLSRGYNSVNFELTGYLQQELAARGIRVVDPEAVIHFMGRNKIRWLGYLDTAHIIAAKNDLQADMILLGTVSQKSETRSPAFGLSLNLVRTADAQSVWSVSGGLSLMDMQTLLGIDEPTSLAELWPVLAGSLMARLPADRAELLLPASLSVLEESEDLSTLAVSHIALEPKFVRPGQDVKCAVEFINLGEEHEAPQVFVKVGTRIHLARKNEQGLFYEANWTGSEVKRNDFREVKHTELKLAVKDFEAQVYEGLWPSAAEDDQYPVHLILKWPSGTQETVFAGTYTVDSTPPDIDLRVMGKEIDGLVTFRDKLLILPNFKEREPISNWQISVENANGGIVLSQKGEGNLPRQFQWLGQNAYNLPVPDGVYRVILEVWDRSGNMKQVDREVAYRTAPPEIFVEVEKKEEQLSVKLMETEGVPIDFWQIEVWTSEGELLEIADGSELPTDFNIPAFNVSRQSGINGTIYIKDILGNKNSLSIEEIYLIAKELLVPAEGNVAETAGGKDKVKDGWASM